MKQKQRAVFNIPEESTVASYTDYHEMIAEENEIRKYVLEKNLDRPHTNLFTIALIIALYAITAFIFAHTLIYLFDLKKWRILTYLICYLLWLIFISKFLAIKCIECYQHYAKEETRRRCLCKPTCSEYAIAVLKKYPFLIAIMKIKKRLFKTCKGGFYKIDLP